MILRELIVNENLIYFANPPKLYDGERTRPCLRARLSSSFTHPSAVPNGRRSLVPM
jgi:hypothetical protein